jgi:purine-binding chemotaxis protein CheW
MQPKGTRQYLTFALSNLEMGLSILEVMQIIEHVAPTRVPHLPKVIRGVINLRGSVVPVVDLSVKLGLETQPVTKRTCIVVVETAEAGRLGIIADQVREVIELTAAEILPTPSFGVPVRGEYLIGLGKVRDQLVLLLDSARVLSPAELLAASQAEMPADAVEVGAPDAAVPGTAP